MQAMTYCLLCGVGAMKDEGEDGNRRVRDALARKVVLLIANHQPGASLTTLPITTMPPTLS